MTAVALLLALAGCSSYFSNSMFGSPTPQQAANVPAAPSAASAPRVQPPPSYTVAAATPDAPPSMSPYPTQSLSDLFKGSTDPVPVGPPTPAGTPMTDSDPAASAYPYPKQSLFDMFRGSSSAPAAAAAPAVPRPPSTYTPSAQPYTPPPGQPGYSATPGSTAVATTTRPPPAPPPPPANPDPAASAYPYPQKSLFDLFSNKQQPAQ